MRLDTVLKNDYEITFWKFNMESLHNNFKCQTTNI